MALAPAPTAMHPTVPAAPTSGTSRLAWREWNDADAVLNATIGKSEGENARSTHTT
jgi:hypothetical protein